jgi:chromate transport protein ChrA
MMSAAGLGAAKFLLEPSALTTAIVAGLSAAGVALVVDACLGLGRKLVTTTDTQVGLKAYLNVYRIRFGYLCHRGHAGRVQSMP